MDERPVSMSYASAMTARRSRELTHGWVRLVRAGIVGGASLTLATAAHVLGGGALPGAGLLAVTGVGLALAAVSLTARRLRFEMLLAVLSVEQLLLHLLFHASTTMAGCATVTMPGHTMAPTSVCVDGGAATTGWSMLVAHAVAVAATAGLLARGERWLWRVVDRIRRYAAARPSRSRRIPQALIVGIAVVRPRLRYLTAGPRAPPVV
jgi:hypothetical protein